MPAFETNAEITWTGSVTEGSGTVKAGSGAYSLPVTFPARVERPNEKTSPEELIAGAHAACYAMALSAHMGRKNAKADSVHVKAIVSAEFTPGVGLTIKSSRLQVTAKGLQGASAADFPALAKEAEGACPVSNALRNNLQIDVEAKAQ